MAKWFSTLTRSQKGLRIWLIETNPWGDPEMVNRGTKTAGPIRRGFEYQDLMALRFALELYIENKNFQMYLEYDKSGGLDDIVIFLDNEVHAY